LRQKLISLSIGYELISKCKNDDNNLIELYKYNLELENNRFIGEMRSVIGYPTHTVSNFIIKNLLEKSNIPVSGILITEEILATRIGIDISKSIDWKNVLENLKKYKYRGVFSEGWERWWMSGVEHWWRMELGLKNSIRATPASQKIDLLKDKLGLTSLVPIEKNEKAKSEAFWTNCVGSGISIDNVDGLLVDGQDNFYPWQDKKYVCYEEALKPKGKDKWKKISPSEEYKLEILQKQFPNVRPLK
jgi:hypothetical protein